MDSHERQDPKQNDQTSAVEGARNIFNHPWVEKHGNKVLLILVLLIAALAVRMWANNRFEAMQEQIQAELANATSPESLDNLASSNISDINIRSLAMLRSADLYLDRATAGPSVLTVSNDANEKTTTTTDPASDARNAARRYEGVLEMQNVPTLVRLNALLGLAAAHENLKEWDKADQAYKQLLEAAGTDYPLIATQAKNRQALLPRLKEPVRFAPEAQVVEQAPADAPQPAGPAPLPGLGTPLPAQPQQPAATQPAE